MNNFESSQVTESSEPQPKEEETTQIKQEESNTEI